MTSEAHANNIVDAELDQLTYSAYLLTLDPDLAFSVAMAAIDMSIEDLASGRDLLQRTIEISLAQLRLDTSSVSDRQSLAIETLLYGDTFPTSSLIVALKERTKGSPILLLDSDARIAFVLHHVLGYPINRAAVMTQISEKKYHTRLLNAYVQLASLQLIPSAIAADMLGQIAQA